MTADEQRFREAVSGSSEYLTLPYLAEYLNKKLGWEGRNWRHRIAFRPENGRSLGKSPENQQPKELTTNKNAHCAGAKDKPYLHSVLEDGCRMLPEGGFSNE
jgi:hypothetical protein